MPSTSIVRQFLEVFSENGRESELEELVSEDAIDSNPVFFQPPGRAGVAYKLRIFRAAYPEARSTIEEIETTSEGIRARWRTELSPGGPIQFFTAHFTIKNNKIAAVSTSADASNEGQS